MRAPCTPQPYNDPEAKATKPPPQRDKSITTSDSLVGTPPSGGGLEGPEFIKLVREAQISHL